jgi:hypothetical protein
MGYTTEFSGEFTVTPALKPEHARYLQKFSETRRMKRNQTLTAKRPDPIREAVGLPVGVEGEFFVGAQADFGQENTPDILDYNGPPARQPGLWCKWEPGEDGTTIRWSGAEKFYDYDEWLQYLIDNFLKPWGYIVEGIVKYEGEDPDDFGRLRVDGGDKVVKMPGQRMY